MKDYIPVVVSEGHYDIPSDVVTAIGNGDHAAGIAKLKHLIVKQQPSHERYEAFIRSIPEAGIKGPLLPEWQFFSEEKG